MLTLSKTHTFQFRLEPTFSRSLRKWLSNSYEAYRQTDGRTDRQTDRQTDGYMNRYQRQHWHQHWVDSTTQLTGKSGLIVNLWCCFFSPLLFSCLALSLFTSFATKQFNPNSEWKTNKHSHTDTHTHATLFCVKF